MPPRFCEQRERLGETSNSNLQHCHVVQRITLSTLVPDVFSGSKGSFESSACSVKIAELDFHERYIGSSARDSGGVRVPPCRGDR